MFLVANVHLDSNPERTDVRIEQLKTVQEAMDSAIELFRNKAIGIVCGDFNFTPQGEEQEAISPRWNDCWEGYSSPNVLDTATSCHWTDTWRKEAQLGCTAHYGRIDRIFLLTNESDIQLETIKLVGTGVTVEVRNGMTIPVSDHDGIRADFLVEN